MVGDIRIEQAGMSIVKPELNATCVKVSRSVKVRVAVSLRFKVLNGKHSIVSRSLRGSLKKELDENFSYRAKPIIKEGRSL